MRQVLKEENERIGRFCGLVEVVGYIEQQQQGRRRGTAECGTVLEGVAKGLGGYHYGSGMKGCR